MPRQVLLGAGWKAETASLREGELFRMLVLRKREEVVKKSGARPVAALYERRYA
jgi:hypothetical protein